MVVLHKGQHDIITISLIEPEKNGYCLDYCGGFEKYARVQNRLTRGILKREIKHFKKTGELDEYFKYVFHGLIDCHPNARDYLNDKNLLMPTKYFHRWSQSFNKPEIERLFDIRKFEKDRDKWDKIYGDDARQMGAMLEGHIILNAFEEYSWIVGDKIVSLEDAKKVYEEALARNVCPLDIHYERKNNNDKAWFEDVGIAVNEF